MRVGDTSTHTSFGICSWYTEKYYMNREQVYSVNNDEVVTAVLEEASLKPGIVPVPEV
jgi:hypothetical protein